MKLEHIYQVENAKPPFVTGDTDVEASQESSDNDNDNNKHYNIAAALQDKENKNSVPVSRKKHPSWRPLPLRIIVATSGTRISGTSLRATAFR